MHQRFQSLAIAVVTVTNAIKTSYGSVVSAGCGLHPEHKRNEAWSLDFEFNGQSYNHHFSLPHSYDVNTPVPLMMWFHGWSGDAT